MLESSPQYHEYEYAVELWLLYHLLSERPLFGHDIGADLDQHYYAAVVGPCCQWYLELYSSTGCFTFSKSALVLLIHKKLRI